MPLWSRSTASLHDSAPSSSSSPSSTPTPPSFLSQHHRRSSSNLSSTSQPQRTQAQSSSKLSLGRKLKVGHPEAVREAQDDDPWEDGSDDDEVVQKLAGMSSLSLAVPGGAVEKGTSPATPTATAGGGWSFNPFGAFASSSSSSPSTPATPLPAIYHNSTAEAVAAALSSSTASSPIVPTKLAPPSQPQPGMQRGGSYIAGVNKVQEEADELVREEEERRLSESGGGEVPPTEGQEAEGERGVTDAPEMERRGSGWQRDQLRSSIRPDVENLVNDPTCILPRLRDLWLLAPAPTSPSQLDPQPRASTSSATFPDLPLPPTSSSASDDDDTPPGYAPLNSTSLSSRAPAVVDYRKDELGALDPEEEAGEKGRERRRRRKFLETVGEDNVDLAELRKLSWSGIPEELRPMAWQLLLVRLFRPFFFSGLPDHPPGYLPSPSSRRASTLARKRQEYADAVRLAFSRGVNGLDGPIWHQISIDVPRTRPGVRLWMGEGTQRSLERILYVWAIRHPASGYVQGINDLVTPFFQVFLSNYIDSDPELFDPSLLPPAALEALEADAFWCLSKLLDGIQDNYIFAQPGITRAVRKMEGLCRRVDAPLAKHLQAEGVEFIQFAFRWMNCLLMRELSVKNIVRMWDTYLAEGGDAFSEFHLYVCLAFLVKWSAELRDMDFQVRVCLPLLACICPLALSSPPSIFHRAACSASARLRSGLIALAWQSIIMFLQSLPTQNWTDQNTELLLSEAFMWSRTFEAR
ncbi:SPOSA6832_01766, partial [Sporobolomyces salmonicolor]